MHAFDVLGDPVRRRILELIADGERAAGDIGDVVQDEFGITQPAVSQHLRVLKEAGLVRDQAVGTRRIYEVDPEGFGQVRTWFESFWTDALAAFKRAAEAERSDT